MSLAIASVIIIASLRMFLEKEEAPKKTSLIKQTDILGLNN